MKSSLMLKSLFAAIVAVALAACSPSASQLKKIMQDNPDILHAAIEADPAGFFEVVQKSQGAAREGAMKKQMADELARVKEEMKNGAKKPKIDDERAIAGASSAKVTIVEYFDYNCGHCGTAAQTMQRLKEEYSDKVRVVYKHLPILSPTSRTAAEYMEAIALQDKEKALKFHSAIFENQSELRNGGEDFLKKTAKSVGADVSRIAKDRKSKTVKERLDADVNEAKEFEFSGTPGFIVNGAAVYGAYPYDFFKQVIDHVLSEG